MRNFHGHAAEIVLAHGATLGLRSGSLSMPTTTTLEARPRRPGCGSREHGTVASRLRGGETPAAQRPAGPRRAQASPVTSSPAVSRPTGPPPASCTTTTCCATPSACCGIEEIANLFHQHYGAVLVDEFQDLSLQQLDIVMLTCTASRTFAGDPLQGIYSWAGAASQEVEAICCASSAAQPVQLTVSYRSSPAVLAMVNGVSARMGAMPLRARDPAAWPDGGASAAITFATMDEEAGFIARAMRADHPRADPAASVGVIARSGWRRGAIDRAFAAPSVPCRSGTWPSRTRQSST